MLRTLARAYIGLFLAAIVVIILIAIIQEPVVLLLFAGIGLFVLFGASIIYLEEHKRD